MDPYFDVIPDDRGEGIRKRMRKRDGEDCQGRPTKRARADTSALVPPGGDEQKIEEPLKPEDDLDKSDQERLQQGLKYDHSPRSSEEHEHLLHYVKLRRLELLVNNGGYLGQELQIIRADLKAALDLGPPKTWLTIADKLAGTDMNDLRKNVWIACGVLGIDPNHMLLLIKEWAERNRSFYNQIGLYISDCHWSSVADQVCRDLVESPNVTPDADTAANYEKVLFSIQNEYFDAMSRDDPHPNEKAKKLTQEKLAREKKRARK